MNMALGRSATKNGRSHHPSHGKPEARLRQLNVWQDVRGFGDTTKSFNTPYIPTSHRA